MHLVGVGSPGGFGTAHLRSRPFHFTKELSWLVCADSFDWRWGAIAGFTFIGVSLAVCGAVDAPAWVGIAAHVTGLVGPAVFTKVHPARAQARLLAAQAPVTAVPR
ncbi:hypothetical protein ACFV2U_15460 [Streptomyces sp. NPDC059697]|uniref:hypothetical protein n=1 Tax=Streptomyces sp. NPDC059697 TaxID=3346912 RepID=UPI0036C6FF2B